MTARRVGALGLAPLALATALAGCGQTGTPRSPDLTKLPLVRGAAVVARTSQCDRGANAFCALELVVVDSRYASSDALLDSERDQLHKLGWATTDGDTGDERAADSPGHKLRVTYATASGDLKGIDLGWIHRPREITLALSRAMFDRAASMSMLLEVGAS